MTQASSTPVEVDSLGPDRPAQGSRFRPKLALALPLVLLLIGGAVGLRYWLTPAKADAIALSGRIEGYETNLGAKVGGRFGAAGSGGRPPRRCGAPGPA